MNYSPPVEVIIDTEVTIINAEVDDVVITTGLDDDTNVVVIPADTDSSVIVQQPEDVESIYIGDQGPPGPQGPQGEVGPPGESVTGPQGPQGIPGNVGPQGPSGGIFISETPPPAPALGTLWWDNSTGQTFIWYNDGSSSQWVQQSAIEGAVGPAGPIGPPGPAGPPGSGGGGTGSWDDITGKPSTFPPSPHNHPISDVTSLQAALDAKEPIIVAGSVTQYWQGTKAWATLDKAAVGLANVDNTADANKPVSTATQTALNLKEDKANRGIANGYAPLDVSAKVPAINLPAYVDDVVEYANLAAFPGTGTTGIIYVALDTNKVYRWSGSAYVEISPSPGSTDAVPEGATNKYYTDERVDDRAAILIKNGTGLAWTYDDTLGTLTGVVSLVPFTTTNLAEGSNLYHTTARASAAAPVQSVATKTGAVTLVKGDVGLGNVDNTSDASKPISTATQTALDLKANLASPSFTGNPTAPTPTAGDNDTSIATTAFVATAVAAGGGGGASVSVGDAAPVGAPDNSLWWESDKGVLYIRYNDATSTQWVQVSGPAGPAGASATYLQNSVVFDPPSQATNVVGVIQTLTVTGAALGDFCLASFSVDLNGMTLLAWVSAANTVKFQFQNKTAGTLDLASGTVRVRVWKQ